MADTRDIDQHGLECISKATEPEKPGYINRYRLRTISTARILALTKDMLVDQLTVTDVEASFPLSGTLDPDINAITITNEGETNAVYYSSNSGFDTGFISGRSTAGKRLGAGESHNVPVTENIVIYVKCIGGKSTPVEFVQWL